MTSNDTNPQPRLPDYKPKGMTKWDKIMTWTLVTIVVLFGLGLVTQYTSNEVKAAKATPTVTAKAAKPDPNTTTIKLSAKDKWFVDAYAALHHVTERVALTKLIEAGIQKQ
jgi:heme/copper-type cytochrome/quinol oxidase subunit 2